MRSTRLLLAATFAAMTFTAATARMLRSDDEIRQALVGNTITGVEGGKAYAEYLRPDGTVHGYEAGGYRGHWRIANRHICFSYNGHKGNRSGWDCTRVDLQGSRVIWIDPRGGHTYSRLRAGNPRGL